MRQTLSVAIGVIVALVLLAVATRYVHPHWMLATLHSLQLHAVLGCVAASIVSLLIKRHWASWLLLAAGLVLTAHTVWLMGEMSAAPTEQEAQRPGFRLMSFNILSDNYENGEAISQAILKSGADVVTVMEAEPILPYIGDLSTVYPYRIGCGVMIDFCDQLLLSKTPLVNGNVRSLSGIFANRFVMAETVIRGRKVGLGGIHTTKPYFDEFHMFELLRASLAITDTAGPFVLSGDFNASTLEPDMRDFLKRTDLRTAAYEPPTWPVALGPFGMPIDHIYVRAPLKISTIVSLPDALGSNHNGLIADIVFTGP